MFFSKTTKAAAEWAKGSRVPYNELASCLEKIEALSGKKKIDELAKFYLKVIEFSPTDLTACIYLSVNQLGPAYEGLELGIADNSLIKAVALATGRKENKIKEDLKREGDLGTVAQMSRSNQSMLCAPKPLSVPVVFNKLTEIAKLSGNAAMNKKVTEIRGLLTACKGIEARYLVRTLAGKLRIGLGEQSVLSAIGHAFALSKEGVKNSAVDGLKDEYAKHVKTAYCECPNYTQIIQVALDEGVDALSKKCKLTPGIPLKPMLAHPTKGIEEIMRRFKNNSMTCEWKYDGERGQIHRTEDGKVFIYSRNQENNTTKFPDIIERLNESVKDTARSFIADAEVVALDENGAILPFQVLSTRKRKNATDDNGVRVGIFLFDLLFLNGEPLVRESLRERRSLLRNHFQEVKGFVQYATSVDTEDTDEINSFFDEAIQNKCEGLMIKTLDVEATYEISKRSHSWLKMKKDYIDGVGDTLDLVVMGAYNGVGKRTGVYGGYLLGCYNPDTEEYESVCKIGTGFSDEDLQTQFEKLQEHKVVKAPSYYSFDSTLAPDDLFAPAMVFEVKCADITISPRHRGGSSLSEDGKGISLRFPRFLRIRDDKNPDDATNSSQLLEMYRNQEAVSAQKIAASDAKGEEDDEEEDVKEKTLDDGEEKEDANTSNVSTESAKENEKSPVKKEAGVKEKKKSPVKKEVKSPVKKSPIKEEEKSPAKKEAKSPAKKSSVKEEEKSPVKKDVKSPVKKEVKKTASIFAKKSPKKAEKKKLETSDDSDVEEKVPKKRSRVTIESDSE